jgi:hypothetical protein
MSLAFKMAAVSIKDYLSFSFSNRVLIFRTDNSCNQTIDSDIQFNP